MSRYRITVVSVEVRPSAEVPAGGLSVRVSSGGAPVGRPVAGGEGERIVYPRASTIVDVTDQTEVGATVSTSVGTVAVTARLPIHDAIAVTDESTRLRVTITVEPLGDAPPPAHGRRRGAGAGDVVVALGARPTTPRVEIVHPGAEYACPPTDHVATLLRMGLWERAFEGRGHHEGMWRPPSELRNGSAEEDHFVGCDPRRFYVRVVDRAAHASTVSVQLRTSSPDGHVRDANGGHDAITCTAVAGHPGVFVSRALMIVSSRVDLQVAVHSGDIPGGGLRRASVDDDFRLRYATMFDRVEAAYQPAHGDACATQVELFGHERRLVRLQIADVNNAFANTGREIQEVFTRDLAVARDVYSRIGIWLWTDALRPPTAAATGASIVETITPTSGARGASDLLTRVRVAGWPEGGWTASGLEIRCGECWPWSASGPGLRAFYIEDIPGRNGESTTAALAAQDSTRAGARNISFINAGERGDYTLAHELLHLLVNSPGGAGARETYESPAQYAARVAMAEAEQHYPDDGEDAYHNLLRGHGCTPQAAWDGSSRIRQEALRLVLGNRDI